MLPLSRIAPLMVLANRAMPVLAVMEPELTILPTTLATPNALVVDLPNSMPICPALIEPLLLRPPRKVPTPRTTMPSLCAKGSPFATITLALMMAPAMVSAWTTMPFAADIVPLLTTLPLALVLPSTVALLLLLIAMPVPEVAVILPLLLTPPESVCTRTMSIPVPCAAITLAIGNGPGENSAGGKKNAAVRRSDRAAIGNAAGCATAENREKAVMDAGLRHQPCAVDNGAGKSGH